MRYLCIDLGDKRTGMAIGDDVTDMVMPIRVIAVPPGPALLLAIREAIDDYRPDALVLGLPLNMDGSEGDAAKRVRAFGDELVAATSIEVFFQDERLTSYAADQRMARSGRTHKQKKALRDALAAAEILREFLTRAQ